MPRKSYEPEEIAAKLRQVDVLGAELPTAMIALNGNLVPFKTPCTIRRTRRGTGSCHRHKDHDEPRRWCCLSGWLARAASPAATPPCGYGLS
jgi:hypothetical protein